MDYNIGARRWPGLSKLIEESGEMNQVMGKIIALGGDEVQHWDGTNLRERLEDEMADTYAAMAFVSEMNELDEQRMEARIHMKREKFKSWHEKQQAKSALIDDQQTTLMPKNCLKDGGEIQVGPGGFHICVKCGCSYGK